MKFIGYVIANDSEEYLNSFENTSTYEVKTWARNPAFAHVFLTVLDARKILNRLNKTPGKGGQCWVLDLYDVGSELLVLTQKSKSPKWLDPHIRRDLTDGHTSPLMR
jgi:hypothetical protein